MNKKKLWILISGSLAVLAIAAAVVLLVLFGGKGAQTPAPTVPGATVPAEPYLELNESKITLDVHNDITLQCTASGVTDPVVWTSSDSAIASVDNGKVVALKAGETVISATADSYSAKCTVTVVDKGVVPAFADYTGAFEIRRTNTYDVSPRILFAGSQKSLTDASLTYEVTDSTVALIDANGIATAFKEGTTEFTVSGSFRGISMVPITGTIVVKKNITIALSSLNVQLYACDPDGSYKTNYQLTSAVYVDGVLEQGASLTWSAENEKIATVADGLVQAVRAGETMIHAVYTTPDGDEIKAGIQVQVQRPVIEMEGLQEFDLSNKNGSSTLDFGQLNSYVDGILTGFYDITEEKQELSGASWKGSFSVPNKSFTEHGYRRYAVESELVSIQFDGLAITRKLYSVSDLRTISTSSDTLDGYYRLERDIDAGGSTIALCSGWTNTSAKGFIGTFEGNGHTISNLRVGSTGLFNCIGEATIRNLGLANVSGSGSVLASEVHQATIENIAISSPNCERVFNYVGQRSKIANVIAVLENGKYFITTYGSAADAESTVQNLMVVAGRAEANNGWSGTRVPGIFFNYYMKDDPATLYDLDLYSSKEEMIIAIRDNNELADFNFGIRLDGARLYYNDALICRYTIDVSAPATVHRGSSCTVKALDSTFSLKKSVKGISVNSQTGVVSVAKDVPEFTEFTVVVQHKEYTDVREEVTIRVTIDYKPVQTDVVVRYDLSTAAESYSFTIPEFTETFKRLGWKGTDGFSEGVTVENGVFTLTADAVKALGTGDGKLCVYTEEENVFYVDAVVADQFIYTYEDLAALYQVKTLTGYYMLANDITANNASALTLIGTWTNKQGEGFVGTFNGDGHIISNLKVGSAGLFGYIGGGTVKNLALVDVTGGTSVLGNEIHGGSFTNLFISSKDAVRVFNYVENAATQNVMALLPAGKYYLATNGSASVGNSHRNVYVVVENPVTNNGWSGTQVVGFFENYYSHDDPKSKYNLRHYKTVSDLTDALEKNNTLADWTDSLFSYEGGAVMFNGKLVVVPEITVSGPSTVYRGQTAKLTSANAKFSLKEAIAGITVTPDGTITVAADVADMTVFTVVATHNSYPQFTVEHTITVTIDYNKIDLTATEIEFDLSTNSSRYRCAIDGFEGTYKAIGWEGQGYIDASGISVRNGQLTITRVAMASIGSGSGTLCVYTEEENAYLLNVTIADKFIKTQEDLKSIAVSGSTLDGYYVLANDITCTEETFKLVGTWSASTETGFVGTFDGRGHVIDGYNGGTTGLFYCVGDRAVVKNVAFTNASGTNVLAGNEVHGATFENIFASGSAKYLTAKAWDSPSFENVIFVSDQKDSRLFLEGSNGVLSATNIFVVGEKLCYWGADSKQTNANVFSDVQSLMAAICTSGEMANWNGSGFGVQNSCLTFGGKTVLVPFEIQCEDSVSVGGTITAYAPSAIFSLKEPVAGVYVDASTGVIRVDGTVAADTAFTVTAVSSKFPGYTAEKTVVVTVNWNDVDWTGTGSMADLVKYGGDVSVTLPAAISGNLMTVAYGTTENITQGIAITDGVLTLSADFINTMYNAVGYGEHTIYLCTDAQYRYAIRVTLVTKVLKNQADLQSIAIDGTLDGYFVLGNDIVCDGTTEIILAGYTSTTTGGFIGTFDGRGHIISNVNVGTQGFFRGIGAGTVKNVAFVNVISKNVNRTLANETHGCTFENVFVSSNAKYMLQTSWDSPTFKNVVFISSDATAGRVFNEGDRGTLTATNVFMVGQKLCYWGATVNETNVKAFSSTDVLLTEIGAEGELAKWTESYFAYADGKLLFNGKIVAQ